MNDAVYTHDSLQYTVMSYFDGSNTGADWIASDGKGYYPQTPMMDDIMSIQSAYGAETTTRSGNTVYGFHTTADVWLFDFTQNQHPILCIYDSGGNDTLDLSGWSFSCTINLTPGSFSNADMMTSNISIARSAWIENGVGGAGNDTLIGNAIANYLDGKGGNDILTGGDGSDVFIYGLNYGNDTITDFIVGGAVADEIDLTAFLTITALSDLLGISSQSGSNVVFAFSPGNSLTLASVSLGSLVSNNFIFNLPPPDLAPTGILLSNATVAEHNAGAIVGNVSVIDPDGDSAFTFSVSDPRFTVVGTPGNYQLKLANGVSIDTTPSISLTIVATDQGGLSTHMDFTIAVVPPPDLAPTGILLSNATVAEHNAGAIVGNVSVIDPDGDSAFTFSVSDPRFTVVGTPGNYQLKLANGVSIDTTPSISLTIVATDQGGLSTHMDFTIAVVPPPDLAPTGILLSNATVAEHNAGAIVGNVSVIDPDGDSAFTFSVSDPRFTVVGTPGNYQLKLANGVSIDTTPSISLTIVATDQGGLSTHMDFTIAVVPPPDLAPTGILLSNATVAEHNAGAIVGNVSVIDPDGDSAFTFSVSDPRFTVVGTPGNYQLKLANGVSIDTTPSISLTIVATDQGGLSTHMDFTIAVIEQPDVTVTISGTSAANTIDGSHTVTGQSFATDNCDIIYGMGGNDTIHGLGGDDLICGDGGDDKLYGDIGNDTLSGGAGKNLLSGGDGDDTFVLDVANLGTDIIAGGAGTDAIEITGASALTLNNFSAAALSIECWLGNGQAVLGTTRADTLNFSDLTSVTGMGYVDGLAGNDKITGTVAADDLRGNIGNDVLTGGAGNDLLSGGDGDDKLYGDIGNDTLSGGAGKNLLSGGDGDDTFVLDVANLGTDIIAGGAGTDAIEITGASALTLNNFSAAALSIECWLGNGQAVLGTTRADTLNFSDLTSVTGMGYVDGLAGNDKITGTVAADDLRGNIGNDVLTGGAGNDLLSGGDGKDTFIFAAGFGHDTITDFTAGPKVVDVVQFKGLFTDDVSVLAASQQVGNDVVITVSASDDITLINVSLASLHHGDFLFS